jgi:hypothetical protein
MSWAQITLLGARIASAGIDAGDGFLPGAVGMPAHAHSPYVAARSVDGGKASPGRRCHSMLLAVVGGHFLGIYRLALSSFLPK